MTPCHPSTPVKRPHTSKTSLASEPLFVLISCKLLPVHMETLVVQKLTWTTKRLPTMIKTLSRRLLLVVPTQTVVLIVFCRSRYKHTPIPAIPGGTCAAFLSSASCRKEDGFCLCKTRSRHHFSGINCLRKIL